METLKAHAMFVLKIIPQNHKNLTETSSSASRFFFFFEQMPRATILGFSYFLLINTHEKVSSSAISKGKFPSLPYADKQN